MRGRCLYPETKQEPVHSNWLGQRGWRAETGDGWRGKGMYFVVVTVCLRMCSVRLCEWVSREVRDSPAVLLTYCQETTYTPHTFHHHHHQAVIAISYIFYAYQSLVLLMPITPHLSPDVCQSVTFFSPSFFQMGSLPP